MSRQALTAALALTLVSIAAIIVVLGPQWTSWPPSQRPAVSGNASSVNATPASPPPRVNVTVRLVAVPGGAGVALVNGSRVVLPAVLRVARCSVLNVSQASKPGWEALNGSLLVRACRDTEVRLAWRRIYATVRFEGEGPFQLDGKNMSAPVTVKLPLYTLHNVTQLPYKRGAASYTPLNRSLTLNVTGNVTVRLAWMMRCMGVSFRSEPVRVKGLPKCLPAPVTVEFPIEGPAINGTHRYWLAWYWVEENGSKWWWSPGINGSKLHITKPANVTLHYLPGLKNLPYVKRVVEFPDGYFNGSCPLNPGKAIEDYRLEHGWLHVYNPRKCAWEGDQTISGFMIVTFEIPVDVRLVNICIRTEKLRGVEIEIVPARPGMIFANTSIVDVLSSRGIPGNNICLLVDLVKVQGYTRKNVIVQDADQDFRTGLNKYGFVKLPADYYKHCSKYCWRYPQCSSCRFLTIELSTTRIIAKEMWVSIMGVAP